MRTKKVVLTLEQRDFLFEVLQDSVDNGGQEAHEMAKAIQRKLWKAPKPKPPVA